jgi:serine/threonine-protein phosphatase PP1 catalytic subunit
MTSDLPSTSDAKSDAKSDKSVTKSVDSTNLSPLNIDSILERLMSIGKPGTGIADTIKEREIMDLLIAARELFMQQDIALKIKAPVYIIGDVHGLVSYLIFLISSFRQYSDLMRIFGRCGMPHIRNYLFLGDYVDRGKMSVEVSFER